MKNHENQSNKENYMKNLENHENRSNKENYMRNHENQSNVWANAASADPRRLKFRGH